MANKKKNKNIDSKENYLLVYPNQVKEDIKRAVNTMGFIDKKTPESDDLETVDRKLEETNKEIKELEEKIEAIKNRNKEVIEDIPYSIDYYEKVARLKIRWQKGTSTSTLAVGFLNQKSMTSKNLKKNTTKLR